MDGKGELPHVLRKALDCRRWDTLTRSGGWLEQDVQEMSWMNTCLNVYDVWIAYKTARDDGKASDFLGKNPSANRMIGVILRLDLERVKHGS